MLSAGQNLSLRAADIFPAAARVHNILNIHSFLTVTFLVSKAPLGVRGMIPQKFLKNQFFPKFEAHLSAGWTSVIIVPRTQAGAARQRKLAPYRQGE